jgi:hypothetical protein
MSSRGIMMLNFRLLYCPREIMDSVIIHELCHTKVRNHQKEFWDAVYGIVPDYRQKRS